MPIYVFKCPKCAEEREVVRSFSAIEDPELCYCLNAPSPGTDGKTVVLDATPMARIMYPGGSTFHLKGGGWAKDGYRSKR